VRLTKTANQPADFVPRHERFKKAGLQPVPVTKLMKKLGPKGWRLLQHVEGYAKKGGQFYRYRWKTVAELGWSEAATKKQFRKLIAVGLMRHAAVPKVLAGVKSWRNYRQVCFVFAEDSTVWVTAKTKLWLETERRGGARPGAGRPRGSKSKGVPQTIKQGAAYTTRPIQPDASLYFVKGRPPEAALPFEDSKPEANTGTGESGFSAPVPGLTETTSVEGTSLRGKMTSGGRPPPPGFNGVPRFPGPTVMPPATVPGPPMLPEGLGDEEAVDRLLKAYRGATEARTKKKCWVLSRAGEARKSKHWPVLLAAARKLEEFEWRPGAWVMWRLDSWAEMHPRSKEAPLKWVFSVAAMEEHGGWFESESGHYSAPRIIYNPLAQDVLRRYQAMQMELLVRGAVGEAAVKQVVEKHWPGDAYRRAVAAANARTQEDQMLINRRIQRGDWVW